MTTPSPEEAAALEAERRKLGPDGDARVRAVQTFLEASTSPAEAKAVMASICTAQQVEAFEKLMASTRSARFAAPAPSSPVPLPPDPDFGPDGRASDAAWAKMTHAERLDYSRKWDQAQFWKGGPR